MRILPILLFLIFAGCQSESEAPKGEKITRTHDTFVYRLYPPVKQQREAYPWEEGKVADLPRITKEFFRCKGCQSNPPKTIEKDEELVQLEDCRGLSLHGLPLREGKEFIYPILIDLLNEVQARTERKVVITSGHRCPAHNTYVDASHQNLYSKHQFGAEVSFYVRGMEYSPEKIITVIREYYLKNPETKEIPEYTQFERYTRSDTNVATFPWFNKEIFIKLFQKQEGRNFDNRHPYPYISIQVRHDRDRNERVAYTWKQAHMQYLRR